MTLSFLAPARMVGAISLGAALAGCASLSPDHGFSAVQEQAKTRIDKEIRWARNDQDREQIREQVQALLSQPLTADIAVQIALLNNRGLQATYSELGIAEANLVQAGRLRNPGFSFQRLERSGAIDIERKFLFDLLGLLTLPTRSAIESRRFEQAKLRVTSEVLRVAAETRRAWIGAVAAQQGVRYMEDVKEVADASADLARRMAAVGNWSKLDQSRQQVFYADTLVQLGRSQQASVSERERLTRLMGLEGKYTHFALPERLPELPLTPRELSDAESTAIEKRLDIQAARKEVEGLAKSLGLTRTTRFVNVLEASYLRNSSSGAPIQSGYEVELSIPLFDFGEAKVAHAEATYLQAVNRLSEIAINARSEVREAYAGYRTSFELARHYRDEIVPLRKQISDENLLRYNGMLISVFELLADARSQMASINSYIEAQRDFWMADANLESALTTGGTAALAMGGNAMTGVGEIASAGH